ncbi:MAG: SulP family inorganic anion transporter, partial [Duodenibacillus sp.]|nr:SulP family inorganic anion transporter [Duodenibacillus sp.]
MIFTNIKGNIAGGLTAGIIALPLALAFGIASGLGASAGLWGALVLGFFAALFGGTKMQVSGPTGPMSVVSASIVLAFQGDIGSIMSVFVLAGVFQICFGVLRLGKFVKYIPYSVISGFMTGVGFIIILLQINPMLGVPGIGDTLQALMAVPRSWGAMNPVALLVSLVTVVIVYKTPAKVGKLIPPPLLAILVLTPLVWLLNLPVATIGDIPTGFAKFTVPLPRMDYIVPIVAYALALALLGSIDSLLTSLVADSITKTKHRSNQELIGQGIGNALVGFVGGIPGAGATMRTVANINAGGTDRLSGMTHAVFLLLVVLVFAPVVKYVPLPVLAGILLKVGVDILDYRMLRRITTLPKSDLVVMLVVFFVTVLVNLILAVFLGIGLAVLYYLKDTPKAGRAFSARAETADGVRTVAVSGPLYFGTAAAVVS